MNDGYSFHHPTQGTQVGEGAEFTSDLVQGPVSSLAPQASRPGIAEVANWLPRLGPVLWLEPKHARLRATSARRGGPSRLFGHPALAPLSSCRELRVHSEITAKGPREWLCFHSADDEVDAKLFLLPDSDLLAWDQMCAAMRLTAVHSPVVDPPTHATFMRRAISRLGRSWQACLFEFRLRSLPGLHALDVQPPLRISLLGLDIAQRIMDDEHAVWMSPLHRP